MSRVKTPHDDVTSVEFEIFGKVRGVYMGTFVSNFANQLGVVGTIRNTYRGTMAGIIQGHPKTVSQMKGFLERIGSPWAKIKKVAYKNEVMSLSAPAYDTFRRI